MAEGLHINGSELKGFEIAGADGRFVAATAKVEGPVVVVSSPEVAEPVEVRYGWQSFTDGNLYNSVPLPASTFAAKVP